MSSTSYQCFACARYRAAAASFAPSQPSKPNVSGLKPPLEKRAPPGFRLSGATPAARAPRTARTTSRTPGTSACPSSSARRRSRPSRRAFRARCTRAAASSTAGPPRRAHVDARHLRAEEGGVPVAQAGPAHRPRARVDAHHSAAVYPCSRAAAAAAARAATPERPFCRSATACSAHACASCWSRRTPPCVCTSRGRRRRRLDRVAAHSCNFASRRRERPEEGARRLPCGYSRRAVT